MTTLYRARWLLPISSPPVPDGALAVEGDRIVAVGAHSSLSKIFPLAKARDLDDAAIIPGLVNSHSHLELTAMRGFLDSVEDNFFSWLKKLTAARLELTPDDLYVSAAWGACEAARAGVTCLGDSSDSAEASMSALINVGLRGTVYQESFGPDPRLATENFQKLKEKVARLRELQTASVRPGVSPHAPYTVCAPQLELIAEYTLRENLPLMMHAAESAAEELLLQAGLGAFAEGLDKRGIRWKAPGLSTVQYLREHHILDTRPLLAHCVTVNEADLDTIHETASSIAHCPRSNAKLGHGQAPFAEFVKRGIKVGLGSDSVASNNSCDLLSEARYALLMSRSSAPSTGDRMLLAEDGLRVATLGGARALGLEGACGELREGLQADFAVISLTGTHQFPSYDPVSTLVFASSGADVMLTVVAGREVFAEGQIQTLDEPRLRARMKEIVGKLGR
jgi:5-methylthioadenosine/S-adenosylhomocysteine deaminase